MLNRTLILALFAVLTISGSATVRADRELKEAVENMLDVGWPGGYKTRAAADEGFKVVQSVSRGDERAVYAYILVLIKQRRYPDAENLLEKLVAHDKDDIHAWKAKAWLSVILRKYDSSLTDLDRISLLLPAAKEADKPKIDDLEFVEFMGRIIGYLEGPVATSVNQSRLDKQTVRIDARLNDAQADAFEDARQSVLDTFNSLANEGTESKKEAEVEAEQQREQLREELDEEAKRLDSRRDSVQPEVDKLREEVRAELKAIADEAKPLAEQINRLEIQAFDLQRQQTNFSSSAVALQTQAAATNDPSLKNGLELRASDLAIRSNQYRLQINQLERRAYQIAAQRNALAKQYSETQKRYEKRLVKLEAELKNIEKLEKKNAYQAKRATKSSAGDLRRTRSLGIKAKALSTYEDFSLEDEKQRVLDLF